jgi:hypothetical protein
VLFIKESLKRLYEQKEKNPPKKYLKKKKKKIKNKNKKV